MVVIAALAVITVLAWAYVLSLSAPMTPAASAGMADMPMNGMAVSGMANTLAPAIRPWAPATVAYMFVMWSVMMFGMMTPSVAPMILLYAQVGRKAVEGGSPFASTGWFFAGYLAVWTLFSALATGVQWALTQAALLTPMKAASSAILGGALLIGVGVYQWTPVKQTCLKACQAPLSFLMAHGGFRGDRVGATRLGVSHGVYCLGCCVALMALLFVGGVMNVLWIAGLTILILLEKVVPTGRLIPRISGALIGAAGVWMIVRAV